MAKASRPGVPVGLNRGRPLVVEDDLELVDRIEVLETLGQFGLDGPERGPPVAAHAARAIEDVDELVALADESEEAGAGLAALLGRDGEAEAVEVALGR